MNSILMSLLLVNVFLQDSSFTLYNETGKSIQISVPSPCVYVTDSMEARVNLEKYSNGFFHFRYEENSHIKTIMVDKKSIQLLKLPISSFQDKKYIRQKRIIDNSALALTVAGAAAVLAIPAIIPTLVIMSGAIPLYLGWRRAKTIHIDLNEWKVK